MSGQNNDNSGMAIGFAVVATGMFFLAMMVFAIAAFASIIFTVIALCAWNRPITLLGETWQPHEARSFVKRGLLGMVLLPVFAIFCSAMFKLHIVDEAWLYIVIAGYALGSIGVEIMMEQAKQDRAANATYIPPMPPASLPSPQEKARPQQPREPFTFGDWNDEEKPR